MLHLVVRKETVRL